MRELDLGVLNIVDSDVRPGESKQFGEARAGECGDGEESTVRLLGGGDRLLEFPMLEYRLTLTLRRLRTLGREQK